ncbi:putative RING finger protein [Lachnellula subtilissima]|uniref:Putative RING finger protein n=1 Tax=Lachnellula subtilissima TaxID=602034 RepID=A0A8H8RJ72_9HELO|nr:putative RING finger protein [Lachnellula subtilissima]
MAPPTPAPASRHTVKHEALVQKSLVRGATPSAVDVGAFATETTKSDQELAITFKADLTSIRSLVTCSICDQLLYEPWTLACGHTYCYSCLCNWFIPNKRKKSCPECRTRVQQIPAPNYLTNLSTNIHKKRSEEVAEVDRDRTGAKGLFKGAFPVAHGGHGGVWRDEADDVWRCPECNFEHEGGPACQNCGFEMDDEDIDYGLYSDIDDDADIEHMDNLSLDMEGELDAEFDLTSPGAYLDMHINHPRFHTRFPNHMPRPMSYDTDTSGMYSDADDDEEGSLDGFVAPDDEEEPGRNPVRQPSDQRAIVTISDDDDDDESDEGGAVSNRMPRRRARAHFSPTPSVVTVTDNGANDSDAGDMNSEMLRTAGWSPLDQGNDSEVEEQFAFRDRYGYEDSDDGQSDESDTETMVGGDEGRSREDYPETPTYDGPPYIPHEHIPDNYESLDEDADDDDSEAGDSSVYDRDGDTEMSASPRASRSVSVNTNGYGEHTDYPGGPADESRSERSVSRVTDDEPNPYGVEEYLGGVNQFHDIEDDDDESDDPRPPPRRRQFDRFNQGVAIEQQFDPQISRMFADHQQSLRGAHDPGRMVTMAGLGERNRRTTAYRNQISRRNDPLRGSRSPSANRVIASSNRHSRPPRQYMSRVYN